MSIKNIQFIAWMLLIAGAITLVITIITMIGGVEGPTFILVFMALIFGPIFLITGIIGLKKAGPNVIAYSDIYKILIIALILLIGWSIAYSVFRPHFFQSCIKKEEKIHQEYKKYYGEGYEYEYNSVSLHLRGRPAMEYKCNIYYPKNPILYFFR